MSRTRHIYLIGQVVLTAALALASVTLGQSAPRLEGALDERLAAEWKGDGPAAFYESAGRDALDRGLPMLAARILESGTSRFPREGTLLALRATAEVSLARFETTALAKTRRVDTGLSWIDQAVALEPDNAAVLRQRVLIHSHLPRFLANAEQLKRDERRLAALSGGGK